MHSSHKTEFSPFITIITVSRNAVKTIKKTIDSVKFQNFKSFEHIIIDGASTDGTCPVIESYIGSYPLQYISEPDSGIADAMNKGVMRAKGRYILMLHADDRLFDRKSLQQVFPYLHREIHDIYSAPVLLEYLDGTQQIRKPYRPLWWYHFKTPFCHQGTLVHRRLFDRVGGFRDNFSIAMDYDFFYRTLKIKPSIFYHKRPLSVMGAYGIGSRQDIALKRIDEEYEVQRGNELNPLWKVIQFIFRVIYRPYKKALVRTNSQVS